MRSVARLLAVVAVVVTTVFGLVAPASAVVTCTSAGGAVTIGVDTGDTAVIVRNGDEIMVNGAPCAPPANVSTTNTITVDSSGSPTEVAIDLSGGLFEGSGGSEIPFTVDLPSGRLRIVGSTGDDHVVVGQNGINLNADETTGDADVTITGTPQIIVDGAGGADSISVGGGSGTGQPGPSATLLGQLGDDTLHGGAAGSTLDGGDGVDTANYSGATQLQLADLSTGSVTHQAGGTDALIAIENLTGSPGDDLILGDEADNVLRGGDGTDTIDFSAAASGVSVDLAAGSAAGQGSDTLEAIENVIGSPADDDLTGDGADNVLAGATGDDTIDGGAGADTLVGGEGNDTASFASSSAAVTVDLRKGTAKGDGDDTIDGFENVLGSGKADSISGNKSSNELDGRGGKDDVSGGDGTDEVLGGDGNDLLFGGNGNDIVKGGNGKDQLNGGKGTHDICKGGADPDSFVFCENFPT
ncbi:MAG: calcium-binding protein [Actinomycetota bacterium]